MKTKPPWFYHQSGVVPYRAKNNTIEILLITSRGRGHWIIPKGVIDPGTTAKESACNEAYEEAGIRGRLDPAPIGEYQYRKWGGICTVMVFGLEILEVLEDWPERFERQRQWMSVEDATNAVEEPALKKLIAALSSTKEHRDAEQV